MRAESPGRDKRGKSPRLSGLGRSRPQVGHCSKSLWGAGKQPVVAAAVCHAGPVPFEAREYGLKAVSAALDGITGTAAVHIRFGHAAVIHAPPREVAVGKLQANASRADVAFGVRGGVSVPSAQVYEDSCDGGSAGDPPETLARRKSRQPKLGPQGKTCIGYIGSIG